MVCQAFKMLHLFLCPIFFFPSHTLCFHLVPFFSKMVHCILRGRGGSSKIWSQKFYLFSSVGTNLKGMPYKQDNGKIKERLKHVMLTVQHIYRDDVIYQSVYSATTK